MRMIRQSGFWLGMGGCLLGLVLGADPVRVELVKGPGGAVLLRDGEPYYIKGAGGLGDLELLAAIGGNSVRTWGDTTLEYLDRAHAAGLSVLVGLWIDHERHGFDYSDDAVVAAQIRRHCEAIDALKDHPAVLMWGIGNEVELQHTNPRVWDVIEAVAAHAKKVDPFHPTMTAIAHAPEDVIHLIKERCPSIDILGCNSYGGIGILVGEVRKSGWDKPYIVTEWGSDGSWEVKKTAWGAEIEASSSTKAHQRALRYGRITGDRELCLGAYAFHWGSKQETTPTWFNLFTPDGRRTESIEVLEYVWTGDMPAILAPRIGELRLNNRHAIDDLQVKPGATLTAEFDVDLREAEWDNLTAVWSLSAESIHKGFGGDLEQRPEDEELKTLEAGHGRLVFRAPCEPGAYRLFLYLNGPGNTAATANFPFLVK